MTTVDTTPGTLGLLRSVRWRAATAYWLTVYKRLWRGSMVTSFVEPVLFLAAMGLGLGTYVHGGHGHGNVEGVSYLSFLAPGLLAANSMQTGMAEGSWAVLGAVKWTKGYIGMQATPLETTDIFAGHYAFMLLRVVMNATIFTIISGAFGVPVSAAGALLALLAAILTGAAFAAAITGYSIRQDKDLTIALLYRFGLVPMFLFSGTFFPVSQLPQALQPVAWITPLWHGVALCRDLDLGTGSAPAMLGHAAYLVVLTIAGCWWAARGYRKRLTW